MNWVDSFYPIRFDMVLEVLKNSKTGKNGIRYFYGLFLL